MMSLSKSKYQAAPDWNDLRRQAIDHAEKGAERELAELQKSLKELFPNDVPVTIQLFQPIGGGRLVDVGPRPKDAPDGLVFQRNDVGRTGDIFQDAQAAHRYIPLRRKVSSIAPGTFSEDILHLEKLRYPDIGKWAESGPPPTSWIHQLPLASLPQALRPRTVDGQYRYANLGAAYTVTRTKGSSRGKKKDPAAADGENFLDRLILYALRAGEIAQQVRFEMLCGGDYENCAVNPTECRIRAARCLPTHSWSNRVCETEKIDKEWKSNIDGGLCRLVGTLILHHHWWYPYDPIAYELICRLTDEQYAKRIYHLHHSCSPEYERKHSAKRERTQLGLLTTLSEDLIQIISSYRNASLDEPQQDRVHRATLTMVRQLCGPSVRRHGVLDENRDIALEKKLRSAPSRTETSTEVRFQSFRGRWDSDFKEAIAKSSLSSPIVKSSTLRDEKTIAPVYADFVLSLLSPGASSVARPNRSFKIRTDKRRIRISDGEFFVEEDKNGDREHFLYWHTRALLKLGPYLRETEDDL